MYNTKWNSFETRICLKNKYEYTKIKYENNWKNIEYFEGNLKLEESFDEQWKPTCQSAKP